MTPQTSSDGQSIPSQQQSMQAPNPQAPTPPPPPPTPNITHPQPSTPPTPLVNSPLNSQPSTPPSPSIKSAQSPIQSINTFPSPTPPSAATPSSSSSVPPATPNPVIAKQPQTKDSPSTSQNKSKVFNILKIVFLFLSTSSMIVTSGLIFFRKTNNQTFNSDPASEEIYFSDNVEANNEIVDSQNIFSITPDKMQWNVINQDESLILSSKETDDAVGDTISFQVHKIASSGAEIKDLAKLSFEQSSENKLNIDTSMYRILEENTKVINNQKFYILKYSKDLLEQSQTFVKYFVKSDDYLLSVSTLDHQNNPYLTQNIEALLATISFDPGSSANQVKGAQTATVEEKVINYNKPSIARIYNKSCSKLSYNKTDDFLFLDSQDYEVCLGGLGSGFFIEKSGYIATNGHVVKINDEEVLLYGILLGQSKELLQNYHREVVFQNAARYGLVALDPDYGLLLKVSETEIVTGEENVKKVIAEVSDEQIGQYFENEDNILIMVSDLENHFKEKLSTVAMTSEEYSVQLGKKTFDLDEKGMIKNASDVFKAELIDYNFDPKVDINVDNDGKHSDVAILKIDDGDYPVAELGNISELNSGSSLVIMGYPAVGTDNALVDVSSASELTATKGIVSAIKKAKGNTRNLLQTDASISSGNSGGPGFDMNGKVVGIATYGIQGENFNYLIDINDLIELMNKNNITNETGKMNELWKTGLENYSQMKYKTSLNSFNSIKQMQPDHISVDHYIDSATQKIANGEDRSSFFSDPYIQKVSAIGGGTFVLSTIMFVVMLFLGKSTAAINTKQAFA